MQFSYLKLAFVRDFLGNRYHIPFFSLLQNIVEQRYITWLCRLDSSSSSLSAALAHKHWCGVGVAGAVHIGARVFAEGKSCRGAALIKGISGDAVCSNSAVTPCRAL